MLKREVKHQIIEGIHKKELVFMKFSLQDSKEKLEWEHSKEFEFEGEMYDIVEKKIEKDSISYLLWWDHKETELNKRLNKSLAGIWENNEKNKKQKKYLIDFNKALFHEALLPFQFRVFSVSNKPSTKYVNFLSSVFIETHSPPPESLI